MADPITQDLVERLRGVVSTLSITPMNLSLSQWSDVSGTILEAAEAIEKARQKALEGLTRLERDAPEPYEYMTKADFNALPKTMQGFISAYRSWRQRLAKSLMSSSGGDHS